MDDPGGGNDVGLERLLAGRERRQRPIVAQRLFPVSNDETARSLYDKHKRELAVIVPEALDRIANGEVAGIPQDEDLASYCAKRTEADGPHRLA